MLTINKNLFVAFMHGDLKLMTHFPFFSLISILHVYSARGVCTLYNRMVYYIFGLCERKLVVVTSGHFMCKSFNSVLFTCEADGENRRNTKNWSKWSEIFDRDVQNWSWCRSVTMNGEPCWIKRIFTTKIQSLMRTVTFSCDRQVSWSWLR